MLKGDFIEFLCYFLLDNCSKSVPCPTHYINHTHLLLPEELHTPGLICTDQSLLSKLAVVTWKKQSHLVKHKVNGRNALDVKHFSVSRFVPPICFHIARLAKGFKTKILPTILVTYKTCLLIITTGCLLWVYHSSDVRVSKSNWNS